MENESMKTIMTFMKTANKVKPTEIGHKYNIVLWRFMRPKEEEVELFTAILGDPQGYVQRIGSMGYSGFVVKKKACKNDDVRKVFNEILNNWGFEEKLIQKVIKKTVV
jgi:hypothetical protein